MMVTIFALRGLFLHVIFYQYLHSRHNYCECHDHGHGHIDLHVFTAGAGRNWEASFFSPWLQVFIFVWFLVENCIVGCDSTANTFFNLFLTISAEWLNVFLTVIVEFHFDDAPEVLIYHNDWNPASDWSQPNPFVLQASPKHALPCKYTRVFWEPIFMGFTLYHFTDTGD